MRQFLVFVFATLLLHGHGFQVKLSPRSVAAFNANTVSQGCSKRSSSTNFALKGNGDLCLDSDGIFMTRIKAMDIPNKLTVGRMLAIPLFCSAFQLGQVSQ